MMRAIGRGAKRAHGLFALAFAIALAADPLLAEAQNNPPPAAAPAPAETAAPAPAATPAGAEAEQPPENSMFSREELEKLLAPIALYPDPLLAQMLPASAYPVQIVQAQRWLDKNKALVAKNDYSGIDNQNWDPAVKALARFPDVIKLMSADLDWTTDLGDAEVNQPQDVADVIQDLRAKAEAAGTLKTTDQQTSNELRRARLQGRAHLRGRQRRKPRQVTSPSSRPILRPSMSRLMIRPRSTSPIPASRLFWVLGPASLSGRCGTIIIGIGERARSIRQPGRAIRAGVATSTTATSTSAITSTSDQQREALAAERGLSSRHGQQAGDRRQSAGRRRPTREDQAASVDRAVPVASGGRAGSVAQAVRAGSAVPEALAESAVQAGQAALAAQAGQAELAAQAGQAELAVQAGQAALAVQAGQAALAAQAGQAELAVQAGQAELAVQAGQAVAPVRRRGPLAVLLGGRTSAGREARRWAV